MARIIIDYPDDMPAAKAMQMAGLVVESGKVSVAGGVPHYCWFSAGNDIGVATRRKKRGQLSDSLSVQWIPKRAKNGQ